MHPAGNVRKDRTGVTGPCGEAAAGLEKCWAELISRDTDKATLNSVLSSGTISNYRKSNRRAPR